MAEAVERALVDGQHLIVEAGHGRRQELRLPGAGHSICHGRAARRLRRRRRRLPSARAREAAAADHHLDPHDQPAGAAPAKGPAAAAERDSRGIHGRAGQRPRQLSQPAADEPGRRTAGQPVFQQEEMHDMRQVIAWSKKTGDGSLSDLLVSSAAGRLGRSGTATAAIAWAASARRTRTAFTFGPPAGAQRPDSDRQSCPVFQRPGAAAERAPASCPITTP